MAPSTPPPDETGAPAWGPWRTLLEVLFGDLVDDGPFVERVFLTFLESQARQLQALRLAAASQDLQALTVAAHTLKGAARTLALGPLATACAALEQAGRAATPEAFDIAPVLAEAERARVLVAWAVERLATTGRVG